MSIKVMSMIWDQSSHEGSALLLLLALADHASDDGICWPGIPRLARKARKTERHIKRLLTKLEESGELYVARGVGRGNTNLYYIPLGFSADEMAHTLIKRFEFDTGKAARAANHIANLQGKGDAQDTFLDARDNIKGDIQGQEKVTPASEKVTPASRKGDIAMSPEPSLTIIKSSEENQEKSSLSEKTKAADPLLFDLERQTLENKETNYANPSNDALVDMAITCLGEGNGPKKGSGTWYDMANVIKPIHADWGLHDEEVDEALGIIKTAIALFLEEKQQMAVYKYPSFTANYGQYLSRAMNGDTGKAPRPRDDPDKFNRATRMTLERLAQHDNQ